MVVVVAVVVVVARTNHARPLRNDWTFFEGQAWFVGVVVAYAQTDLSTLLQPSVNKIVEPLLALSEGDPKGVHKAALLPRILDMVPGNFAHMRCHP